MGQENNTGIAFKKVEKHWFSECGKYELYRHTFRDKKSIIECYAVPHTTYKECIGFTVDKFEEAVRICMKHKKRAIA